MRITASTGVPARTQATAQCVRKMSDMAHDGHSNDTLPMNVSLTPELEALIQRKLTSGLYKNAAEVVREGLRLLAEEDEFKAEVRRKVAEGMAQARSGQLLDGDEVVDRLHMRIDAHRKPSK